MAAPDLVDASAIQGVTSNYKCVSPQMTDLTVTASSYGYAVLPLKDQLSFKEAGLSVAINVHNGVFVNKGDDLADLTFDQDEVQTNIELTQIAIDKENADFVAADKDYEDNLASARAQARADTDSASRQIDGLRVDQLTRNRGKTSDAHDAAIKKLSEDLAKYQAMTKPEQMTAPYDGYIDYTADKSPDDPVAAYEVLVEICDTSVYQLTFSGKATDFCYNMPVDLVLRDKDKTQMKGVIVSDYTDVDSAGKRVYIVQTEGQIPNLRDVMQIGYTGGFTVTANSLVIRNTLTIPAAAVQADESKSFVNILEDGVEKKRYVKVGAQSSDSIQILDGLTTADQVITN